MLLLPFKPSILSIYGKTYKQNGKHSLRRNKKTGCNCNQICWSMCRDRHGLFLQDVWRLPYVTREYPWHLIRHCRWAACICTADSQCSPCSCWWTLQSRACCYDGQVPHAWTSGWHSGQRPMRGSRYPPLGWYCPYRRRRARRPRAESPRATSTESRSCSHRNCKLKCSGIFWRDTMQISYCDTVGPR